MGKARTEKVTDWLGNEIGEKHFDEDGKPCGTTEYRTSFFWGDPYQVHINNDGEEVARSEVERGILDFEDRLVTRDTNGKKLGYTEEHPETLLNHCAYESHHLPNGKKVGVTDFNHTLTGDVREVHTGDFLKARPAPPKPEKTSSYDDVDYSTSSESNGSDFNFWLGIIVVIAVMLIGKELLTSKPYQPPAQPSAVQVEPQEEPQDEELDESPPPQSNQNVMPSLESNGASVYDTTTYSVPMNSRLASAVIVNAEIKMPDGTVVPAEMIKAEEKSGKFKVTVNGVYPRNSKILLHIER